LPSGRAAGHGLLIIGYAGGALQGGDFAVVNERHRFIRKMIVLGVAQRLSTKTKPNEHQCRAKSAPRQIQISIETGRNQLQGKAKLAPRQGEISTKAE
jgi:hypothetical protein